MGHEYGDYSHRKTDLTNLLTPEFGAKHVVQNEKNEEELRKKINIFAPPEAAGTAFLGALPDNNIWTATS